jgi:hypothetical protein
MMIIEFKTDIFTLDSCLSDFLELLDKKKWSKRSQQLIQTANSSPFQHKIIGDYHWLEFSLLSYLPHKHSSKRLPPSNDQLCALFFTQTVVNVHGHMNDTGKKKLVGRLNACLKAETGFAPLYIEFGVARTLFDDGYNVDFTDLEGVAQYDLRFSKGSTIGEVECKSISCDAGRKIHRKDFYRFIEKVIPLLNNRLVKKRNEIILVTLKDRLAPSKDQQSIIYDAVRQLLESPSLVLVKVVGDFFDIKLQNCNTDDLAALDTHNINMKADIQKIYGKNCHVSGAINEIGMCVIVMNSVQEDDTSAALLDAIKKATSQFSKTHPAFITVQYDDIEPTDLLSLPLRRKVGIISTACFQSPNAGHVAATCIYAYRGLAVSENGIGYPSFVIANPLIKLPCSSLDFGPFLKTIPDNEYTMLLGKPVPRQSISKIEM